MGCTSERAASSSRRALANGAVARAGAGAETDAARQQRLVRTIAQSPAKIAMLRVTLAEEQRRLHAAQAELAAGRRAAGLE